MKHGRSNVLWKPQEPLIQSCGVSQAFRISMAKENTKQPCAAHALKTTALLLTHG